MTSVKAKSRLVELLGQEPPSPEMRRHFRAVLRAARSGVLANSEGFETIAFALEELGRFLDPRSDSLSKCAKDLIALVKERIPDQADRFERDFFVFRQSRNDRMHLGAHARDAASIGVGLALTLEEALSVGWMDLTLEDVMTRDVVTAEAWSSLDDVRHKMLRNAYSAIPARVQGSWYVLTDRWLARKVCGKKKAERQKILNGKVEDAVDDLPAAEVRRPDMRLTDLAEHRELDMVLVGEGNGGRLLGILCAADLL